MHPNLKEQDMNSPYSPSFNSFYNTNLAEIADRVTAEFTAADDEGLSSNDAHCDEKREDSETVYEDDFEFNLPELELAEGEIRPVYPVFDRDLLRGFDLVGEIESRPSESSTVQNQLKILFLVDRDGDPPCSSSSSSDADDLDRIPAGTYCVWAPNKSPTASPSPGRCTKSSSTGSSAPEKLKAWKLRDLLKRSRSDGKDGNRRLMLLTPKKKADVPAGRSSGSNSPSAKAVNGTPAARQRYSGGGRSREAAAKNKRKSYLPYKQDLLGFFVTSQFGSSRASVVEIINTALYYFFKHFMFSKSISLLAYKKLPEEIAISE